MRGAPAATSSVAGLVASADDPSALFYNPAGITQLKGIQTQIGVTAITPSIHRRRVDWTLSGAGNYRPISRRNWFSRPTPT